MRWSIGKELSPEVQRVALSRFVYRYTREHIPAWATEPRPDGQPYVPQFASDADWLAHTKFAVCKDGTLDERTHFCLSAPTWPDGRP
jgi:hypothetical protein